MSRTFLIADTHFNHFNVIKYESRPWATTEEMDSALINLWNSVVRPEDRVYHLGDVSMSRRGLMIAHHLNGRKVLIKGNHDTQKLGEYAAIFDDVRATHQLDKFILSHMPIHHDQKYRFDGNIHGHIHSKNVLLPNGKVDPWYFCVSVEHINYTPILFEEVKKRFNERR